MNALNLDKLNLVSPYTVWCKDEGEYGFKTDFDVFFRIYFSPDQTIWHQGAIVQRTNPKLEKIIADFDNFIGFFQTKPQ